jgi:16S rRNA (guanine966-N2)-methyltransferase
MRITGGLSKGRVLAPLKGLNIRPTADKVRESIFNLLGQDMTGLRVLDLFAGTGSLGIEALSRGALQAVFMDHSKISRQLIKQNLMRCGFESAGYFLKRDLTKDLPWEHPFMQENVDLVFMDPPYGKGFISPILHQLSKKPLLKPSSIVITESRKTDPVPSMEGTFRIFKTRLYGETKIDMYHREGIQ